MAAPRSALSAALASYGRPRPPRRGGYQGRAPQPRSRLSGVKASSDYLPGWPAAARVEGASATGRVNPSRRETEVWRNLGGGG